MTTASALEDARGSSVRRVSETAGSRMSERLWDLRWSAWSIDDITVEPCTFADAMPFIAEHYPRIFPSEPNRFFTEKMTPAKQRFYAESDAFLFRLEGTTVGVFIGQPIDWATYYLRTTAILREHRGRNIFGRFVEGLSATLRGCGVQRIEFDTSPANVAINRVMLGLGAIVTGTLNTDRWGALLHHTLHLEPEAAHVFERQFMVVPDFGRTNNRSQPGGP